MGLRTYSKALKEGMSGFKKHFQATVKDEKYKSVVEGFLKDYDEAESKFDKLLAELKTQYSKLYSTLTELARAELEEVKAEEGALNTILEHIKELNSDSDDGDYKKTAEINSEFIDVTVIQEAETQKDLAGKPAEDPLEKYEL